MAQRMTMVQLAQLARLDVSTVSRALRGDARRVSPATIERIRQLALQVGYLPDANAASLRSRRSHVLGMLVPDVTEVVLATLFEAVSTAAIAEGYLTIVVSTRTDPERRRAGLHSFLSRRVDGVILADATLRGAAPEALASSGTPFVMVLRPSGRYPSVAGDDVAGGRIAAEHLLDAGHRAMCVVGGQPGASTVRGRTQGFVRACRRAGVTVGASAIRHEDFSVEGGYRAMLHVLEEPQRPSAVFAVNDYNAIGAARALQEKGAVVGRDVALVGYNDLAISSYLETPLTTVRVDHAVMGREAVRLLLRRIDGEETESVRLEPELVVRSSSAVVPGPTTGAGQRPGRACLANSPRNS